MRIVSLCPSNTEIDCALDLGAALVGLDRSSDWPSEVRALPRGGPDTSVDVDAIAALEPDLVLSSLSVPGKLAERAGWRDIPGIRAGQVHAAEECLFGRPGPRLVEGVEWLHERIAAWA